MSQTQKAAQIKTIWGMAKGLGMEKEDVYAILLRETNKDSMRACTTHELRRVVQALIHLKEFGQVSGDRATKRQVWKIKQLEQELGWQDNPKRLASFLRKYYKVERAEWLTRAQAWRAIESLKKVESKTG